MAINSTNFQLLLEPRFRKIFFETYAEKPEQFSKIYNINTSKKAQEHDYTVAGLGMWPEKDPEEPTAYEDINPGFEIKYTHKSYSKGFRVTEEMYEDEQYTVMDKLPKSIARGGRATVETTAAATLNNSFTVNGADGVPMFSDSHPLKGNAGGTCDNYHDGVFSDAHVKELILLCRQQVNDAGLKIEVMPTKLVIPEALEFTALTVLNSIQTSGTPNNDKNVIMNKLQPIVLSYLTSTTAWWVFDPDLNEMNFFWRKKPTFKSDTQFDTDVAKYKGKLRFSCGYSDWRGWAGSVGTQA